ncbi:MAG: FmdB family zinc ribbon protein [Armatimonadota bacterium]
MPIYEFICKKCKNKFEDICKSGTCIKICPKCGGKSEKVMSVCGFSSSGKSSASLDGCSGCSSGNCSTCGH